MIVTWEYEYAENISIKIIKLILNIRFRPNVQKGLNFLCQGS